MKRISHTIWVMLLLVGCSGSYPTSKESGDILSGMKGNYDGWSIRIDIGGGTDYGYSYKYKMELNGSAFDVAIEELRSKIKSHIESRFSIIGESRGEGDGEPHYFSFRYYGNGVVGTLASSVVRIDETITDIVISVAQVDNTRRPNQSL